MNTKTTRQTNPYSGEGLLTTPLTKQEIQRFLDKDGYFSIEVAFDIDEMMNNIDDFNDIAEGKIIENGIISDIGYCISGVTPGKTKTGSVSEGVVHITVTAHIDTNEE